MCHRAGLVVYRRRSLLLWIRVEEHSADRTVVEQEEGDMRPPMDCIDTLADIRMAQCTLFHHPGRNSWH